MSRAHAARLAKLEAANGTGIDYERLTPIVITAPGRWAEIITLDGVRTRRSEQIRTQLEAEGYAVEYSADRYARRQQADAQ